MNKGAVVQVRAGQSPSLDVSGAVPPRDLVARVVADEPVFHSSGTRVWNAMPRTLELIAAWAKPGDRTLETGAGASTVVFAGMGSVHVAVSPFADEHVRIRDYCASIGVDTGKVTFVEGPSDDVLPALQVSRPVDLAFIDGKHSFPHPIVDFHYIERRMRVGGILLVDDVPIPAVGMLYRFLEHNKDWRFVDLVDRRAAVFEKLAEADFEDNWRWQALNARYPDYGFLPWRSRVPMELAELGPRTRRAVGDRVPALRSAWQRWKRPS